MNFGDVLRSLLEERNITQKKLAIDLNIAPSTIGGYVQNSSEPDFETFRHAGSRKSNDVFYFADVVCRTFVFFEPMHIRLNDAVVDFVHELSRRAG